ncbi:MAG: group 1 truncated hemoglobin [Planctomycetaceae bacterium]
MSDDSRTLFERVGGEAGVSEMITQFYARVLSDLELRPFFENTSVDRLKRMQQDFFAAALDGPMQTGGTDLAKIHHGRGITRRHFTRFVNHLIAVLDRRDAITRHDAMDIVFRIATYSDQVIGESGGADG